MAADLVPQRGALSVLTIEVERELTREDLLDLVQLPSVGPPPIKVLSARHRRQAQLLAEGKSVEIVAQALGTTSARLYQLKRDPTFAALIAEYADQIQERFFKENERLQEKLLAAGETAIDEINHRLEGGKPESDVPYGELRKTVEMAMDRTVAPPKTAINQPQPPAQITLNFGTKLKPRTINQDGQDE